MRLLRMHMQEGMGNSHRSPQVRTGKNDGSYRKRPFRTWQQHEQLNKTWPQRNCIMNEATESADFCCYGIPNMKLEKSVIDRQDPC